MYESELIEYTNRHKMEETTAKVFARLHHMKSILYKTIRSKYFSLKLIKTKLVHWSCTVSLKGTFDLF